MTNSNKSQAATEFLLITAFFLLLIIPAVFYFYTYAQETATDVEINNAEKIGNEIIYNAEEIFYFIRPAKIKIPITLPQGINNISVSCHDEQKRENCRLIINIFEKPLTFHSKVEISGSFDEKDYGKGRHIVVLEKMRDNIGDFVNITFQ